VREDSTGRSVVVADLATGTAQRIGSAAGPGQYGGFAPQVGWSADGRHLAYFSLDLHRVVVVDLDRQNESTVRIPDSLGTGFTKVVSSPDGSEFVTSTLIRDTDWGRLWIGRTGEKRWAHLLEPFGESIPLAWQRDGWIYFQNTRPENRLRRASLRDLEGARPWRQARVLLSGTRGLHVSGPVEGRHAPGVRELPAGVGRAPGHRIRGERALNGPR